MIIRGELKETHKKRLASLDRPVFVHVLPLGALSAEGLHLFKDCAKTFKRHRFLLATRKGEQTTEVLEAFAGLAKLKLPNVRTWLIEGDISGAEIGRWHARMEKGFTTNP